MQIQHEEVFFDIESEQIYPVVVIKMYSLGTLFTVQTKEPEISNGKTCIYVDMAADSVGLAVLFIKLLSVVTRGLQ